MQPATTSTPLKRLALHSTATCAVQASAYGQCILANMTEVSKDSCKAEFDKFGACLREAVCICASHFSYGELRLSTADEEEIDILNARIVV